MSEARAAGGTLTQPVSDADQVAGPANAPVIPRNSNALFTNASW